MKNLRYILILVPLLMASCNDFLEEDPKGRLTPNSFFQNADDLNLAVTALYHNINGLYNTDDANVALLGGDDVTTRTGSNKGPYREFDTFRATNATGRYGSGWANAYAAIRAANNIIVNYESATEATQTQREHAAGQAYFVRALSYFYLVRVFRDVPLVTDLSVDLKLKVSPAADIYNLIVEDLKRAEAFLPNQWDGLLSGIAPTEGSAKSLLASVYLTMAGYPLKDESKYALAAQKAKEVIDNADQYGYRLLDNFADLWTEEKFNDEIVFGLFYNANTAKGAGLWYNVNMRAPNPSKPEEEGGWDDYFAELNFFEKFPEGPRKDATFQTIIRPDADTEWHWTEGVQKHPYYKKMRDIIGDDPSKPWQYFNWFSGRTNPIIRFAEVLLTYAEAQAMAIGPDQSAYNAVNRVRNRAGLEDLPTGLSKTEFRDAVVEERAWEFAGLEANARWFDLVRLERVEQAAADRHPDELEILNAPTKEDYFAPIPQSELQINPGLAD